jgi:hypothetical protein
LANFFNICRRHAVGGWPEPVPLSPDDTRALYSEAAHAEPDQLTVAARPRECLTALVDENEVQGEIDIEVETDIIDVDDDGTVDAVSETTTTVVDVDGDGVPDIVQRTTTVAVDVDGDGIPDIIERTTITGVDANRDGVIDEDEIEVEVDVAVREDLLEE